jgi:hypothetical protein
MKKAGEATTPSGCIASNSRDYNGVTVETFGPFIQSYIGTILSYSTGIF